MRTRTKTLIGIGVAAVIGGIALAGVSYADRGFGAHHGFRGHHGHGMGSLAKGQFGLTAMEMFDAIDTDGDGIREDDEGRPIAFEMMTNEGNSVRQTVGAIIHEGMEAIGLDVDYAILDFGEIVTQLSSTYNWDTVVIGFTGGTEPHGGITLWHSGEGLHFWNPNQPEPATEWEAEIDALYVNASKELDRQRRVALYHRAQEIVAENVPIIYTTLSERISAVRNVFGNMTATLYGLFDVRYVYRTG